jgi:sugar lactone lactonase YvrE
MKKIITIITIAFCLQINAQIITTVVGNGIAGFNGDGGQATSARIKLAAGSPIAGCLIIDTIGNMYIADYGNSCIRKVNTLGVITTVAGIGGSAGYYGDGGQATAATLNYPTSLTKDRVGNLYIADFGNSCIRKVNTLGVISTIAGTGVNGYSGTGGQATAAKLSKPTGVAIDTSGNIYIADSGNNKIRKINTSGIINDLVISGLSIYTSATAPNYGGSIVIDAYENLYISNTYNGKVIMVNPYGSITTLAGMGTSGSLADSIQATLANIGGPQGIALDANSNLYITEPNLNIVRKVDASTGLITTVAGNTTYGFSGDNGPATAAKLESANGVAIDLAGNLYIADYGNNRIRKVSNSGNTTNIVQNAIQNEFSTYPNPNNGNFVLELPNKLQNVLCILSDVNGKVVFTQTINHNTNIDVKNLSNGIYNLNIITDVGVVNKRIIILK